MKVVKKVEDKEVRDNLIKIAKKDIKKYEDIIEKITKEDITEFSVKEQIYIIQACNDGIKNNKEFLDAQENDNEDLHE